MRSRQFVGDLLILVTFLGAFTGEPYFLPFGGEVVYGGTYAPLQNVPHEVDTVVRVSVDVWAFDLDRGGILFYGLILWTALGRYVHGTAAFALAVAATATVPLPALHLAATAGLGAVLADAARRERQVSGSPPSTRNVTPVRNGLVIAKTTASAMSSGVPIRRAGLRVRRPVK